MTKLFSKVIAIVLSVSMFAAPLAVSADAVDDFLNNQNPPDAVDDFLNNQNPPDAVDDFFNSAGPFVDLAREPSCAQSVSGGAVSQTLQGLANKLLGSELSNTSVSSIIGDAFGGSSAGNAAANIVLNAVSGNAGDIVSALGLSGGAGNILQGFLQGNSVGDIAGDALGNLFGSGGSFDLGSIFGGGGGGAGGAISGILGGGGGGIAGIAGGLLGGGGGEVPVGESQLRELTQVILELTGKMEQYESGLVAKECIYDVITRQSANAANVELAAQILEVTERGDPGGNSLYAKSLVGAQQGVADATMEAILADPSISVSSKAALRASYAANRNPVAANAFDCGKDAVGIDTWTASFKEAFNADECTGTGKQLQLESDAQYAIHTGAREVANELVQGQGFFNTRRCEGHPPNTSRIDCPVGQWIAQAPAIFAQQNALGAINVQQRALDSTDEAGDAPAGLVDLALRTVIGGLGNFLQRAVQNIGNNNNGGGGSGASAGNSGAPGAGGTAGGVQTAGTYLDQLRNAANQVSTQDKATIVGQTIALAAEGESAYQEALKLMINNANATASAYSAVNACYQNIVASPVSGVAPNIAQARATQAAQAASFFAPQVQQRTEELVRSQTGLAQLISLGSKLQNQALTAGSVDAINAEYGQLKEAGLVRTAAELDNTVASLNASAQALQVLQAAAAEQLFECQTARAGTTITI